MVQINNLESYKMLVHSSELQNSKIIAASRSDIADFLCLSFWNGIGVKLLFLLKESERRVTSVKSNGLLSMIRFLKRRSIFSNFKTQIIAQ